MGRSLAWVWMLLSVFAACVFIVAPTAAAIVQTATLAANETTFDGRLTLVVRTLLNGSLQVTLRNNRARAVLLDRYASTGGYQPPCRGERALVPARESVYLCTLAEPVPLTPDHPVAPTATASASPVPLWRRTPPPAVAHGSLQVALTWHLLTPRPRNTDTPSPSPSPLVTGTAQP